MCFNCKNKCCRSGLFASVHLKITSIIQNVKSNQAALFKREKPGLGSSPRKMKTLNPAERLLLCS